MSEWETMLMDFMVDPKDDNATWAGNNKNWAVSAALGGWDFSKGTQAPGGTTFWGCSTTKDDASGDTGVGTDAAWAKCYKVDGGQKIAQDDGSEKEVQICEFNTILGAITHDMKSGPLENGVWIGGNKHTITRKDVETGQNNEFSFTIVNCLRKGEKGFIIVCTDSTCKGKACIVLAEFEKNNGCTAAMATTVAIDFAKWLKESGTDASF